MEKILLGNRKSKRSVNVDNKLTMELKVNQRTLPFNDVIDNINLYDVYNNEKNKSNKYRLIFSINPICSNVLFNAITEVVYKEGSDDVIVVPTSKKDAISYDDIEGSGAPKNIEPLYTRQAIRDTEYSHPQIGPYVYHCGYDIFNNHTLRTSDFILINDGYKKSIIDTELSADTKIEVDYDNTKNYTISSTFNTIRDYARYEDGTPLKEIYNQRKNVDESSISNIPKRIIHNYQVDNLYTFLESIINNISEENGWFGFVNPSNIDIPNYGDIIINKCMNNNKACEFIDMYPDRSLYSFNPKVNKYRNNRIEKNWNYCLTYPYKNNYDNILINEKNTNGIKINRDCISFKTFNDRTVMLMKSVIKHNLQENSQIQLYIKKKNENYIKVDLFTKVEGIGDLNGNDKEHYFYINFDDISQYFDYEDEKIINDIRFSKIINGIECSYYIREFKRIPNLKFSKERVEDIEQQYMDSYVNKSLFTKKNNKYEILDFDNTLSKIGFSQNIYGDKLSQIVYTDDIVLDRLTDNLNRPLSEVYLTIIKNNKGYDKWYDSKKYKDSDVEYSHAFGKLTAGFDLDIYEKDYNVHCIHNIELFDNNNVEYGWNDILKIPESGQIVNKPNQVLIDNDGKIIIEEAVENSINIDDTVFLGDIVEFSPSEVKEISIEPIYYRFNTLQREYLFNSDDERQNIYIDVMKSDDYDLVAGDSESGYNDNTGFKISEDIFNRTIDGTIYPGNLFPEGYYYLPHYKIKINEFSDTINQGNDILIRYFTQKEDKLPLINKNLITINTITNYYFNVDDEIIIYDISNKSYSNGIIVSVEDNFKKITFKTSLEITDMTQYKFFKKNTEIPYYAYRINDGSGRYLWRDLLKKSEIPYNSDLYNIVFTNNAFYIQTNINFYLKRQDPYGYYGLKYVEGKTGTENSLVDLDIIGNKKDITSFEYIVEEKSGLC